MRRMVILSGLTLVAAVAAAAAQPAGLAIFAGKDFQAGRFSVSPIDEDSRARMGGVANRCLISPETLIHTGLEAADGKNCVHTVVEDTPDRATVAYSCRGIGSGRTTIVKDNRNHFTVDAQGIRGREPFAMRHEVKRIGDCTP